MGGLPGKPDRGSDTERSDGEGFGPRWANQKQRPLRRADSRCNRMAQGQGTAVTEGSCARRSRGAQTEGRVRQGGLAKWAAGQIMQGKLARHPATLPVTLAGLPHVCYPPSETLPAY